ISFISRSKPSLRASIPASSLEESGPISPPIPQVPSPTTGIDSWVRPKGLNCIVPQPHGSRKYLTALSLAMNRDENGIIMRHENAPRSNPETVKNRRPEKPVNSVKAARDQA